jgi:hypothetical protein
MNFLNRKGTRICVSACLLLVLCALGVVDVTVCCGVDGHVGIDTPVSSTCCPSGEPGTLSGDGPTAAFVSGPGGSGCVDIPLLKVAPVSHREELGSFLLAPPTLIPVSDMVRGPIRGEAGPHFRSISILSQLRSTTLLI